MKAVLSLAYLASFPSLGPSKLLDIISLGTVEASVPARPTIAQELIVALGRIQTTTASFSALNMASPLIKSLNLDLIMRRHSNPFDQFDLEDLLLGFEVKKTLEDIPELSDVAGKFVDKAPFLDYFSAAEYNKNQPMKKLEDIAFARAELLPFKVEKGLVDVLTFDEDVFIKWDSALIIPHLAELDDLAQFLYQTTLQTAVGTYDYITPVRAIEKEELVDLTLLLSMSTGIRQNDEAELEDYSKRQTLKRLLDTVELDEVRYAVRPVITEDETDFEITTKKLLAIEIKKFKTPHLQDLGGRQYRQWLKPNTGGLNYSTAKLINTGPFTDRDTELATIESSRWHNNEFKGVGLSFNINPRLNDEAELDEVIYPSRILLEEDTASAEELTKKLLHVGFTKYKRPFYYNPSSGVYSQRYSSSTYINGISPTFTRAAGSGTFTDRDTELAVVESGRWHNNEIKGVGPSLQIAPRLKDIVDFEELVLPVKIHFQRDTVNAEHLIGRYLTTDFIGNRSFEVDASGNKIWSDGLTYLQYIPGPAIYTTEYVEIGWRQYRNQLGTGTVFLGSEVGEDATYVKLVSTFSHYGPGTYISVAANPTQVNNSRMSERDAELVSMYAGRDQLGFGLPLTLEPELFSARTDYVLPVKVIHTKEQKAVLEADISDFFIDLKVINYSNRYVEASWPNSGYWVPYAEEDTAFIEEQAAKFLDMAPFLEGLLSTVEVLPTKAVLPEQELFTASADIDGKNIFIRPKEVSYVPVYDNRNSPLPSSYVETYTEFTAGLSTENSKDTVKTINEYINTAITSDAFRPVFSFDLFKVSDTEAIEVQKSTTEELLSTISDFYRKVSYKRDYQVETALADDVFSAFSQNYSSGYFSQAYVGETIIGD